MRKLLFFNQQKNNSMKSKKIKLKKTLANFDMIDIVDALDSLLMCFGQTNIEGLSEEAKAAQINIAGLLRKDINNTIQRQIAAA